jgi:hypothetical protein
MSLSELMGYCLTNVADRSSSDAAEIFVEFAGGLMEVDTKAEPSLKLFPAITYIYPQFRALGDLSYLLDGPIVQHFGSVSDEVATCTLNAGFIG